MLILTAPLTPEVWPAFVNLASNCGESEDIGFNLLVVPADYPVRALNLLAQGFGAYVVDAVGEA